MIRPVMAVLLLSILVAPPGTAAQGGGPAPGGLSVLYMAQAGYQPKEIEERVEAWRAASGRPVRVTFLEYEDMYQAIATLCAVRPAGYDVVLTDLIWIADFARRGLIDPLPERIAVEVRAGIPERIVSAFSYRGRLWSHPFLANMQILYANQGLLERAGIREMPCTLEEVIRAAEAVRDRGLLKYPLFDSWNRQEVLVCEFTWLTGAFGGSLADGSGRARVDGPAAVQALELMVSLLERGLMNPYSLQSNELFASEVFLNGDAAFITNWTYLLGNLREFPYSRNRLTALPIPASARAGAGQPAVATVSGFQGLSVPRTSARKEEAWDFIRFLASAEFQREHLSELPVWRSVWQHGAVRELDPYLGVKLRQLEGVRNRPTHPAYRELSAILQQALDAALRGRCASREALRRAQRLIEGLGP